MLAMRRMMRDYSADRRRKTPLDTTNEESLVGRIVVITGANNGIGKVTALEMAKRGAEVIMACRDMTKAKLVLDDIIAKTGNENVKLVELDLGDLRSVRKCAEEIKTLVPHINILINNAGVLHKESKLGKTKDGFEVNMGVNHLGHFLFTILLLDHLKLDAPSRVVITSSMVYVTAKLDVDDLMLEKSGNFGYGHYGAYSNSKLANMYFAKSLGKKLAKDGVHVYALNPGVVKTDIMRSVGGCWDKLVNKFTFWKYGQSPEQGAETILFCALSKACAEKTGEMYQFNHKMPGVMGLLSDQVEVMLWVKSAELVRLPPDFEI